MRKIKFRVWCKEGPSMLDWDYLINEPDFADFMKGAHVEDAYYSRLMQYTGLKDKDGKEIYEGDVILVIEWNRKYNVVFERGMFKASGNTTFSLVTATNGELSCQVIGNIYENPELLKN
ncbi:hypothetical protein BK702_13070 [Bacillus thuringiensis serovar cameroun]|nr:hypothetical protein BK702_13070 [Bacillus thuringiensis serovar cameroun]